MCNDYLNKSPLIKIALKNKAIWKEFYKTSSLGKGKQY